jgi:hypothetical protein
MSLLPYSLYTTITGGTPQLDPNISITLSNQTLNNSTINTNRIFLDGNYLDTTGSGSNAALLINGIPITGGNTSSATSSITANWASFPAISTITYATSAGTGGSLIMCNVSSLVESTGSLTAQVGTVTGLTVSTINGVRYPNPGSPILLGTTDQMAGISLTINKDFTGQPAGLYLVKVFFQGSSDMMTCTAVIYLSGGFAQGGSYHQPQIAGISSEDNYVSIQSDNSADAIINIYIYSAVFPNSVVQSVVYRIT